MFSQVDEEVDRFMLFDDNVDHCVDETDNMHQENFFISKMEGRDKGKPPNSGKL